MQLEHRVGVCAVFASNLPSEMNRPKIEGPALVWLDQTNAFLRRKIFKNVLHRTPWVASSDPSCFSEDELFERVQKLGLGSKESLDPRLLL